MNSGSDLPALQAIDVHRFYTLKSEKIEVLKGVNLSVGKGETVFLVGSSGAGKTTLLYTLAGLEAPDAGDVKVNGTSLYSVSREKRAHYRNKLMGFIFQGYHLLPEFTALENVLMPALIGKVDARKEAERLLEFVGLQGRMAHLPAELSGGEQQRVAIARSLINNPVITFADEPTGNLDSQNAGNIMKLILDLVKAENKTLVVVTHDEKLASWGDRQLRLENGILVE